MTETLQNPNVIKLTEFSWDIFPVEMERSCNILCVSNDDIYVRKLLNFLTIINPQKINNYISINNHTTYNYDINSTLIIDCSQELSWEDELEFMNILDKEQYHILCIGNFNQIPKILVTSADNIFFESSHASLNYLQSKGINFKSFDNESFFPVVDKSGINLCVKIIPKTILNAYEKVPIIE